MYAVIELGEPFRCSHPWLYLNGSPSSVWIESTGQLGDTAYNTAKKNSIIMCHALVQLYTQSAYETHNKNRE